MYYERETLDDLLYVVYKYLIKKGIRVNPTKGPNREATGAFLKLKNPRARFSRTEQRATLLSCLGETLWYFSGSDELQTVEYYIPSYRKFSKIPITETKAEGAYGPRLFGSDGQVQKVIDLINTEEKRSTRQAVIQIFDKNDLGKSDVPCTCTIQFLARGKKLHSFVTMRSNDAYRGLPHDIFAFTMLQEYVACCTNHELGSYNHAVGSLHLYDRDEDKAKLYLSAGVQEKLAMPEMPLGDPVGSISWLLATETSIRTDVQYSLENTAVDAYWVDLARLLLIKRFYDSKTLDLQKKLRSIAGEKQQMKSSVYDSFIRDRVVQLEDNADAQLIFPSFYGV